MMEVRQIGVVGAGTMGNGIAQAFAAAGYTVPTMRDPQRRNSWSGECSDDRQEPRPAWCPARSSRQQDREATLGRIRPTTELKDVAPCELVVEAILEDYELKAEVFRQLDFICSQDAILATNTSSISVTQLAAVARAPGRVVGMHFFNPVAMMQLVEVIRALQTSDAVCDKVVEIVGSLGKKPYISKDSYGFVVNRVLVPMINEAINCLHEGLASAADIDAMMKLGANHPIGPLSLADLIGLDIVLDVMKTLTRASTTRSSGRARCSSRCVTPAISAAKRAAASSPMRRTPEKGELGR